MLKLNCTVSFWISKTQVNMEGGCILLQRNISVTEIFWWGWSGNQIEHVDIEPRASR